MVSNAAYAQCTIYSQPNYQGAAGIIQPDDQVLFFDYDTTEINKKVRTFIDKSWLNNIRSSKATSACTLVIFESAHLPTKLRLEAGPNHTSNIAGGAACDCK